MTSKTEDNEIRELRQTASQTINTGDISPDVSLSAQHLLDEIRKEAAEHGFSDAEVVRAILRPIFKKTKGCDCFTYKTRRSEYGEYEEEASDQINLNAA